jgi:hypothetical protein
MTSQSKAEQADDEYEYKKEKALDKVATTLEECLENFHGEEEARISEDIANYTIGYLGVSFGLHVKRHPDIPGQLPLSNSGRDFRVTEKERSLNIGTSKSKERKP